MSINPIITFKAGKCDVDTSSRPYKVKADPRPGYIYLYEEDDLTHFCWRERNAPLDDPEEDLVTVPTDCAFVPYPHPHHNNPASAKTNGRIFVLKFNGSSQRYLFWLQSKPQSRNGDAGWYSPRDMKIGEIVNNLLNGVNVDVARELRSVRDNSGNDDSHGDDGDTAMDDAQGGESNDLHGGSGGAGAGATGGDVREEGEESREGGADGARAAASGGPDAATAVRNFLDSLKGGAQGSASQGGDKLYPLLSDLLPPPVTVPVCRTATEEKINELLDFLPPAVITLSQSGSDGDSPAEPSASTVEAAKAAMSLGQKKALVEKVLRSPQFHQSLGSLSMALRDGGLPTVADALSIKVENGGYMRGTQMPLGGGEAVEAFVEGVKQTVQEKK